MYFREPIYITIDTNVFDAANYDISEDSTLRLLTKYVADEKIKVVLSDIVLREAYAHLTKKGSKIFSTIRNNRKELLDIAKEDMLKAVGVNSYIAIPEKNKIIDSLKKEFGKYIEELQPEILDNTQMDIGSILDDYFSFNAPFENSEKKRKEFPDAFIAKQIRERFSEKNAVIIISADKGFREACMKEHKYQCFDSLGDLYNEINKQNKKYVDAINILRDAKDEINTLIEKQISENQDITVFGQGYDHTGVVHGYDYSETELRKITDVTHRLHVVEDIENDDVIITLDVSASIEMDCYYDDYLNAPWDSEVKEYVFVEKIHLLEKHKPNFACRVKINLDTQNIKLMPIHLYLGGDSRKKRIIIENEDYSNYDEALAEYLLNEQRDSLCLTKLDSYREFLEDKLHSSKMNDEIVEELEDYSSQYSLFDDIISVCDEIIELIEKCDSKEQYRVLYMLEEKIDDIEISRVDAPKNYKKDTVIEWLNKLSDRASEYTEKIVIPEYLEFEKTYTINGIDDNLTFFIDTPNTDDVCEGYEEEVQLKAETENGDYGYGIVKYAVGYQHFDEDDQAADGMEDIFEIDYSDVMGVIDRFISEQNDIIREYIDLFEALDVLKDEIMEKNSD